jgi:predicted transcriptional regulator of viral defense system
MKWVTFLERFAGCAVIEPAMVYAGELNPDALQAQLSRWVKAGRLIKLARGKYALAPPYRKVDLPLEHVANRLVYPSYVSMESALAWYDLIPEAVAVVTSVTTARPRVLENVLGTFRYRHIRRELFWGFELESLQGQECVVALPEKAILDFFYFRSGVATVEEIQEMRFQNLDRLDEKRLLALAHRTGMKKLITGTERLLRYRRVFLKEYDLS